MPLLLLLFAGSGCAALIYEIVWFQLLQLVIGSSAVSLGVLLGTFMGGMCLGSLALARFIPPSLHPLRVFALLEAGIGMLGILVWFGVPLLALLYVPLAGQGLPGILVRGALGAVCLLPPTLLMGATLPAMARWVELTPRGVAWLGFFYGGNIAGGVFGSLLAGFYLLRVHDMATTTYVAATINGTVALIGFGLARCKSFKYEIANFSSPESATQPAVKVGSIPPSSPHEGRVGRGPRRGEANKDAPPLRGPFLHPMEEREKSSSLTHPWPAASEAWPVYLAIGISGLCALGAEVVWTRQLSLVLGPTVYTFSIILAVFLGGLGLGSGGGAFLARRTMRPQLALGACQMLLVAAMAWTACVLSKSLPYWPINPFLSQSPWFTFQLDLARCLWAILPPACLWGASFPLALAAVAAPGQDAGRWVGRAYAANTIGAIVGALACSLLLIAWVGTQQTQRLLIGLSTVAALLVFLPTLWRTSKESRAGVPPDNRASRPRTLELGRDALPGRRDACPTTPVSRIRIAGALLALIGVATALASSVPQVPWDLVAYGHYLPTKANIGSLLYMGEGMNSSIAVTEMSNGVRNFHVSGKIEASTEPRDMQLQRMLGHVPALFHPKPRSVLVVGCGAGITAGCFVVYPEIEKIVVCEIEPLIPEVVATYFTNENYNVLKDPRVAIILDDARHYVRTTREKFDIITSDPIHPWVKGAATLYTQEYFDLCKAHLNPGGVVTQWVPLYESTREAVKSEVATFFESFPNSTIWSNDLEGEGYDVVVCGRLDEGPINVDAIEQRLRANERLAKSLKDAGFRSAVSLLGTYAGQRTDLGPWLAGAEINRDRNLRLQYLAGLGLNLNQGGLIYGEMLLHRRFPEQLFAGTEMQKRMLRLLVERGTSAKP